MLNLVIFLVVLGLAMMLAGAYDRWLFREGKHERRDTISGGFYLGGVWNRRIGFVVFVVGLFGLVIAAVYEIAT